MGTFAKGTIVLVPFPFSDLSRTKFRPAVVLADAGRGDFILCQITSNPYADPKAVPVKSEDFSRGSLARLSYVRPSRLFTANNQLIVSEVGMLTEKKIREVIDAVVSLIKE